MGKVAGEVTVVEVDASDDSEGGVGGERGAEDAGVVADGGADPVAGEVHRIGDDGELPCLEGNVGVTEAGVGEGRLVRILILLDKPPQARHVTMTPREGGDEREDEKPRQEEK